MSFQALTRFKVKQSRTFWVLAYNAYPPAAYPKPIKTTSNKTMLNLTTNHWPTLNAFKPFGKRQQTNNRRNNTTFIAA